MSFIAIRKFTGTGSPEGVVTAPPGGIYTQSDATAGNELWEKATGTGPTGWRVFGTGGSNNVATVAALEALTGVTDGDARLLLGYYAAGDGGGDRTFRRVASSVATRNGGTVFTSADGGRWLQVDANRPVRARDFGARGDDTGNDATFIQAAHDYIVGTGKAGLLVLDPLSTFRLTSGVTINASYVSVLAYGAKLDASPMTSGGPVTVTGTINPPYNQAIAHLEGFELVGNGSSGSVTGINFENASSSGEGPSHASVKNVVVHDFGTGISLKSRSYALTFYTCDVYNCGTAVSSPSGATDYGERISFIGSTFFNCNSIVSNANGNADLYFQQCSFDYTPRMITATGGTIFCTMCHFEDNSDTDYWIYVSGENTYVHISDSYFTLTGSRSTHPIGYSDSTVKLRGLEIRNSSLGLANLSTPVIIAGTGRGIVKGGSTLWAGSHGSKQPASVFQNELAHGTFDDSTALNEWTIGSVSNPPVIDTTTFNSSPGSVRFQPATGPNDVNMSINIPLARDERIAVSFYIKTSGMAAAGGEFIVQAEQLDVGGNSLANDVMFIQTTDLASWTLFILGNVGDYPPGTRSLRFTLYAFHFAATSQAWVDDLIVTVM